MATTNIVTDRLITHILSADLSYEQVKTNLDSLIATSASETKLPDGWNDKIITLIAYNANHLSAIRATIANMAFTGYNSIINAYQILLNLYTLPPESKEKPAIKALIDFMNEQIANNKSIVERQVKAINDDRLLIELMMECCTKCK